MADSRRRQNGARTAVSARNLVLTQSRADTAVRAPFRRILKSAIAEGVLATAMPAALKAAILAAAVPLPPLTIAPAWPMRRPGGAVAPAMKPATGFWQFF